jgi:hypothetical protein
MLLRDEENDFEGFDLDRQLVNVYLAYFPSIII